MRKPLLGVAALAFTGCQAPIGSPGSATSALGSTSIVISQLYPEGGNSGANLKTSFLELFNRGGADQSIGGWSIQYASHATASLWSTRFSLPTATIPAGRYFLVELASGTNGGAFPTDATQVPDATAASFGPAGTSGKVALVDSTTELVCGVTPDSCAGNPAIVDLIGYGGSATTEYEGTPAPAPPSGNNAIYRRANAGCTDTDDNATDFAFGTVPTDLTTLVVRNSTVASVTCNATPSSTDLSVNNDLAAPDLATTPPDLAGTDGALAVVPDLAVVSTDMNRALVTGTTPRDGATGCSTSGTSTSSLTTMLLVALALVGLRRRQRASAGRPWRMLN